MSDSIKIDKGIPLPRPNHRTVIYPWGTMEIGDSFVLRCNGRSVVAYANKTFAKKRFVSRALPEGMRVWRVK